MSKKQVILMSLVVALPAIGLLVALVFQGMENGGNMFSGMMTVVVGLTALLVLCLGLSPLVLMGLYPADGFSALAPSRGEDPDEPSPGTSDVDDEMDDEMVEESAFEDDDDEFEGGDEGGDEGGEELFDDGYDDEEFDDEGVDGFDDDEWE